jgi:hypothetical protein
MSTPHDADAGDDYLELKSFFEAFSAKYFPKNNLPADRQPLVLLLALEKKGRTFALRQLRQMVADCVEMSRALPEEEVQRFDAQLASRGIPGLAAMRVMYSKQYRRILKRGEIRSEDEYRLVQVIAYGAEDSADEDELALVTKLLRTYEAEQSTK